jgi:hypothetical protein
MFCPGQDWDHSLRSKPSRSVTTSKFGIFSVQFVTRITDTTVLLDSLFMCRSTKIGYCTYFSAHCSLAGRGSSVGVATRYRLDGPGIESLWGLDFPHRSRPAVGPTQSPIQWVPGHSRG